MKRGLRGLEEQRVNVLKYVPNFYLELQAMGLHRPGSLRRYPRDHAGPGTRRTLARSSPHDPSGYFAVDVRPVDIPHHSQLVRAGEIPRVAINHKKL